MQSLSFTPGNGFLSVNSSAIPWTVVFEDEGLAGYFYACDRSHETQEDSILDAMLIYNVASLQDRHLQRLVTVEWSRNGKQAALYLDGTAQAIFDFEVRSGYCRTNFPNFLDETGEGWRKSTHEWNEEILRNFEAALYA